MTRTKFILQIIILFMCSAILVLKSRHTILSSGYEIQTLSEHVELGRRGRGVIMLLFHSDIVENQVSTFQKSFSSWKLFILNSIDLFIVISDNFPLSKYQFSEAIGLTQGYTIQKMLVHQLQNSTVFVQDKISVMHAPVDAGTRFTCRGLSKNKGFSRFYVEGTAWYTYQMFKDHATFMNNYEFFLKLDYDIFFFKPMQTEVLKAFDNQRVFFIHTGMAYHTECAKNARQVSNSYLRSYNLTSKSQTARIQDAKGKLLTIDIPSSSDVYYTNFIGGRISFFSSDKLLQYAVYLLRHGGYFKTRWTDQVYWHNALGIHVPQFEKHVKSLQHYRFGTLAQPTHEIQAFVHRKKLNGKLLDVYNKNLGILV